MNRVFTITLTNPVDGTVYTIDENSHLYGMGITVSSMKLDEILCDGELEIGACNSNKFEVQIFGLTENVSGFNIAVTVSESGGTPIPIFTGKVESSETDKFDRYRTIIAYDAMYWFRDVDVGDWWKTFWSTNETTTLRNLRITLCNEVLGLYDLSGSRNNDNIHLVAVDTGTDARTSDYDRFVAHGQTFGTQSDEFFMVPHRSSGTQYYPVPKTLQIKFGALLRMICELQLCCPNIKRDGRSIEFITIGETTTTYPVHNINSAYDTRNSEFQDYVTMNPTGFSVYDTSEELAQIVPNDSALNTNPYPIGGNVFLLSMTASQINSVLTPLIPAIQRVVYKPAKLVMIVSDLSIHLGDKVTSRHKNQVCTHLVLAQSLSGSLLVNQEILSPAYGKSLNSKSTSVGNTLAAGLKFSQIIHDVDGIALRVGKVVNDAGDIRAAEIVLSINEDDTSNILISADKIQLSGTVTLADIEQKDAGDPTIIDGGFIKTNTITADKINVTNLVTENLLVKDSSDNIILKAYTTEPNDVRIGGFTVNGHKLYSGGHDNIPVVVMQTSDSGTTYAFAAGGSSNADYSGCPFRVTHTGELYAEKGIIGGCSIVDNVLTITNAHIQNLDVSKLNGGNCPSNINFTGSNTYSGNSDFSGITNIVGAGYINYNNGADNAIRIDKQEISLWRLNDHTRVYDYLNSNGDPAGSTVDVNAHKIQLSVVSAAGGGDAGYLVGTWKLNGAPIMTSSDKNKKSNISYDFNDYAIFYDALKPASFKFIDGTSGRTHIGFIAQDIETALQKSKIDLQSFAGIAIDSHDNTSEYFLRYEEFIALNTWQIQQLKTRVAELEKQLAAKKK